MKREIDVLKTDKQKLQTKMNAMMDTIEQLKTINDKQKDKIGELTTLLNKVHSCDQCCTHTFKNYIAISYVASYCSNLFYENL